MRSFVWGRKAIAIRIGQHEPNLTGYRAPGDRQRSRMYHDVPDLQSQPLTAEYLAEQDCVLISTDHSSYDFDFIVEHASLIIDPRNACGQVQEGRDKIHKC